jgi:hypothetical protein
LSVGSNIQAFVLLQILMLLAEDAPLETKRSSEGEPSRRLLRSDSPSPSRVEYGATQADLSCASASESAPRNRLTRISKMPTKNDPPLAARFISQNFTSELKNQFCPGVTQPYWFPHFVLRTHTHTRMACIARSCPRFHALSRPCHNPSFADGPFVSPEFTK